MTAPASFRQADLARALKAVKSAGVQDARIIIDAKGVVQVIIGKAANESPPPVELD
jgi:hypothetical protein